MILTKLLRKWFSPAEPAAPIVRPSSLVIDLGDFVCGRSTLGTEVNPADYFAAALRGQDMFDDIQTGLQVGVENGIFDYVFITADRYRWQFARHGTPLNISPATTEADVLSVFGQPYWTDRSDGEVILFYEYRRGTVELQFEFSDGRSLSFITFSLYGVLSKEDQREAYGVTRPWPPS
jgi:hypothetical protein